MTAPGGPTAPGDPTGSGARTGWVPPVLPWPALYGQPTCTVTAGVPPATLLVLLAEELRRRRLRVTVAPDGRSLRAKTTWPLVLGVIGAVFAGEAYFSSPRLDVTVAAQTPAGTALTLLMRTDGLAGMRSRVIDALNAVAWRLAQQGTTLTATPWERHFRPRREHT